MVRDDGKLLVAQKQSTKPMIYVYTAAGKPLSQFQCDRGRIVGMGWSESEQLVTVADDGLVRIYGFRSEYKQFSLGKDAKDHGVNDVRIWGTGLVALTGNFQFIHSAFEEPRPTRLADMGAHPPHAALAAFACALMCSVRSQ